jgi:crotonobetainyl-CoA:carnitine CoA-transferase CaiB-like acyl-CoA transferase
MTMGALDGVVIADFSRILAGPYATMLLADMGARVIKIERPGVGDDTRHWGPPFTEAGMATYFAGINRNKLSIALDLSDPDDRHIALRIVDRADVMVENFRPGALAQYGLGSEQLRDRNPRLITCSISGFGSAAGRDLPGYDLLVQAMGGLMSVTGHQEPTKVGVALVDVLTGLHAVSGILAALVQRSRTGVGQAIEVTLLGSLLSAMVNQSAGYVQAGVVPGLLGNAHPSIAPYEVFATGDQPLVIAVGNDQQFERLCVLLERAELITDPRFATNDARVTHRGELRALLEAVLVTRPAEQWRERLTAAQIPCGPIHSLDQAFAFASELGLTPIAGTPDHPEVAHPIHFSAAEVSYERPAPALDADRAAVLEFLDVDPG